MQPIPQGGCARSTARLRPQRVPHRRQRRRRMNETCHRLRNRLYAPISNGQQRQPFQAGQRIRADLNPSPNHPAPSPVAIGPCSVPVPHPSGFRRLCFRHHATVLRRFRAVCGVRRYPTCQVAAPPPSAPLRRHHQHAQPPARRIQPLPKGRRAFQRPQPHPPPSVPIHQAAIPKAVALPPAPPPRRSAAQPQREGSEIRQGAPSPPRFPAGLASSRPCQRHPGHTSA